MYQSFPLHALERLRCPRDGSSLELDGPVPTSDHVAAGRVSCTSCGRGYPIVGGILRFPTDGTAVDVDSAHERNSRDELAEDYDGLLESTPVTNAVELGPTVAALRLVAGASLLEIGCGTGRITKELARLPVSVVAFDFSIRSLEITARKLGTDADVALVHADLQTLRVTPRAFDRVLSTCGSNLPGASHRAAMYELASTALVDCGRFVFSLYYYNLRRRRKVPSTGRYPQTGVFYEYFRPREVRAETAPWFHRTTCRPIVVLPRIGELIGPRFVTPLRALAHVPVLDQNCSLLLCTSQRPVHLASTASSSLVVAE